MVGLAGVKLSSDVFSVCVFHALCTEREENMGLLIGQINNENIMEVEFMKILFRSDKRADRCEISAEQLTEASIFAEQLSVSTLKDLRILGWYHSHPHITVWPSHIDIRTQAGYQLLDENFVGVIISVFNKDKRDHSTEIRLTCFQSVNLSPENEPPQFERVEIPIVVCPQTPCFSEHCYSALLDIMQILQHELVDAHKHSSEEVSANFLSRLQQEIEFCSNMSQVWEIIGLPLIKVLENLVKRNKEEIIGLKKRKHALTVEISNLG